MAANGRRSFITRSVGYLTSALLLIIGMREPEAVSARVQSAPRLNVRPLVLTWADDPVTGIGWRNETTAISWRRYWPAVFAAARRQTSASGAYFIPIDFSADPYPNPTSMYYGLAWLPVTIVFDRSKAWMLDGQVFQGPFSISEDDPFFQELV